ncbi:MAG: hypothetical protein K0S22_1705 [Oscillospiraceae bacterium]|jgi:hypothetical protein|nr:hypothetical protein [Oscillospiraceae bacterium]
MNDKALLAIWASSYLDDSTAAVLNYLVNVEIED